MAQIYKFLDLDIRWTFATCRVDGTTFASIVSYGLRYIDHAIVDDVFVETNDEHGVYLSCRHECACGDVLMLGLLCFVWATLGLGCLHTLYTMSTRRSKTCIYAGWIADAISSREWQASSGKWKKRWAQP